MLDRADIEENIDKFVRELFATAIERRASDIHIEPFETSCKIRLRVDGLLNELIRIERSDYEKLVTKIKLMSGMDISEKRRPQDSNLKVKDFDKIDFRVSSLNTVNGEKLVLRILSMDEFKKTSSLLGFSKDSIIKIDQVIREREGMIIFSGPTGSGKSTSLYAILNKLNTGAENIVTVEDPVEFKIPGINQVSVNEKIGLDFSTALRSILRQDPDIIMIGEIRDYETAQIAIRAAITGHLVLTTLHTKDAISSIVRLKDLGIEDYLIRSALSLLASQRLVRKLCDCKEKSQMTDREYEFVRHFRDIDRDHEIYRPRGCNKCKDGYLGREAVEEVLVIDKEFREILKENSSEILKEKLAKENFKSMAANAIDKIIDGVTSFEEINKSLDFE
ncbi:GspE/PulE family protein [Anaerococcus sp. AGMB09787]|uniref:GspE/PulE family protein n=1 Tax=Anaerococcus sp. AGMB09787 TaxID=2922869 RepID=UPI001FAFAC85|nr:GspE/PulE family protein [Anaerococcus sp. AGMB09787]